VKRKNFFSGFLFATAKVESITAMIYYHIILHPAVHIYDFHTFITSLINCVFFVHKLLYVIEINKWNEMNNKMKSDRSRTKHFDWLEWQITSTTLTVSFPTSLEQALSFKFSGMMLTSSSALSSNWSNLLFFKDNRLSINACKQKTNLP